jgi:hypothetical protein
LVGEGLGLGHARIGLLAERRRRKQRGRQYDEVPSICHAPVPISATIERLRDAQAWR